VAVSSSCFGFARLYGGKGLNTTNADALLLNFVEVEEREKKGEEEKGKRVPFVRYSDIWVGRKKKKRGRPNLCSVLITTYFDPTKGREKREI